MSKYLPLPVEFDSNLCCSLCNQFVHDPISCAFCMTSVFCRSCLNTHLQTSKTCPSCNVTWIRTTPNSLIQKFINKVPSTCPFCNTSGTYQDVSLHMKTCPQRIEKCCHEQCTFEGKLDALAQHANVCLFGIVTCACMAPVLRKDVAAHILICPCVPVPCNSCTEMIPRSKLEIHQQTTCPHTQTVCVWHEAGCTWKGALMEKQAHLQECKFEGMKQIFTALLAQIHTQQAQIVQLEDQLTASKNHALGLQGTVNSLQYQLSQLVPAKPHEHSMQGHKESSGGLALCSECGTNFTSGHACYDCNNYFLCDRCHYRLYLY